MARPRAGSAVLGAALLGIRAARREMAWPHRCPLVRGLGEAAFLPALFGAMNSTWLGRIETVLPGAALTPADLACGVGDVALRLMFGTAAALLGLLGAGAIRLASRR